MTMHLFRLLHRKEYPEDGLMPMEPSANVSVDDHVANVMSPNYFSQYITTMATYDAVYALARQLPDKDVRIVQIDILELLKENDAKFIDLSTPEGRSRYLTNQRAKNFATKYDVVLIVGNIPVTCMTMYYEGSKKCLPEPVQQLEENLSF